MFRIPVVAVPLKQITLLKPLIPPVNLLSHLMHQKLHLSALVFCQTGRTAGINPQHECGNTFPNDIHRGGVRCNVEGENERREKAIARVCGRRLGWMVRVPAYGETPAIASVQSSSPGSYRKFPVEQERGIRAF